MPLRRCRGGARRSGSALPRAGASESNLATGGSSLSEPGVVMRNALRFFFCRRSRQLPKAPLSARPGQGREPPAGRALAGSQRECSPGPRAQEDGSRRNAPTHSRIAPTPLFSRSSAGAPALGPTVRGAKLATCGRDGRATGRSNKALAEGPRSAVHSSRLIPPIGRGKARSLLFSRSLATSWMILSPICSAFWLYP